MKANFILAKKATLTEEIAEATFACPSGFAVKEKKKQKIMAIARFFALHAKTKKINNDDLYFF